MSTPNSSLAQAQQAFKTGQFHSAASLARALLDQQPDNREAPLLLVSCLYRQKRPAEAIGLLRRYLQLAPADGPMLNRLGVLLAETGQKTEALAAFERATRASPDSANAHNNVGLALEQLGRPDQAEKAYRQALAIKPDYVEARCNPGNALRKLQRHPESIEQHLQALKTNPKHGPAGQHLAATLEELGRPEEAHPWRRRVAELRPNDSQLHSDVLWSTLCMPNLSPEQRFAEHLAWGKQHADWVSKYIRPHKNDRTPDRPLRVGYVSPNFGAQAIGWFITPLLAAHERRQVQVYCYNDTRNADWMTQKIRSVSDQWRDTARLLHDEPADLIHRDRIDILIDLRGHMAGHRLVTFAQKPAPVQMSYIGYQYTAGMKAMDYRICDPGTDPPGLTERFHVEKLARLPRTIWCYQPQEESQPASTAPAERNGHVTFGVFQKAAKLNGFMVELWSRILRDAPEARLKILCPSPRTIEHLRSMFHARQIVPERIESIYHADRSGYLNLHNQVDLALDTFPYSGVTTTCDAMWMGVPVLTLLGPEPFERAGASLMPPCGLECLLADHPKTYVEKAIRLAQNPQEILRLRPSLRERMQSSELMNPHSLARAMELCFRNAWVQWLADGGR
jgi:predicted O-linked N-acetylglucosamine transferase (SPINDLY family)